MNNKISLKVLALCFILILAFGMGFTRKKVEEKIEISMDSYMENIDKANNSLNSQEITKSLEEELKSKTDIKFPSYSLIVNNQKIANLKTKEEVEEILKEMTEEFNVNVEGEDQIKEIYILEKTEIINEDAPLEWIKTKEETIDYIRTGSEELKNYTVVLDETFASIGEKYNLTIEELQTLNPETDPSSPLEGDTIKIKIPKSLITVVTEQEVVTTKQIEYKIEVKEDPDMYDTDSETRVIGQAGENKLVTKHINHNGKLVKEELLSEEVVVAPIDQIVVKGTKVKPKTAATGSFAMPTRGRLSSPFGGRWGRMHSGIDIAKASGSDIAAADGGTVSFSGSHATYGNMVDIDHGNGYKTRYAHSSKLLVSNGEKVYKGQVIAKVGSTGRSTGPHLHFEVIKNGQAQNPLNYVQ